MVDPVDVNSHRQIIFNPLLSQYNTPGKRPDNFFLRTLGNFFYENKFLLFIFNVVTPQFLIGERGSLPAFDRGVGRYVLKAASEEEGGQPAVQRFTHSVSRVEKGKQPEDVELTGLQGGDVWAWGLTSEIEVELRSNGSSRTVLDGGVTILQRGEVEIRGDGVHLTSQQSVVERLSHGEESGYIQRGLPPIERCSCGGSSGGVPRHVVDRVRPMVHAH